MSISEEAILCLFLYIRIAVKEFELDAVEYQQKYQSCLEKIRP